MQGTPDPVKKLWLRWLSERLPLGNAARATVWLELRQRMEELLAGFAGAWLVAALLGTILAALARQTGEVEPIAWLLPGVCLSIYFGLVIGGGHRGKGLDEFQAALPAQRSTLYLTRIGLSALTTLILLAGSFVLLRGPVLLRVWLQGIEVEGVFSPLSDMLTSAAFCLFLAVGAAAMTSSWRPSGRVMRFAKNWPWLLVIFVTCNDGESPVNVPGLSPPATTLLFLVLACTAVTVGWRRLQSPHFLEGGDDSANRRRQHPLASDQAWWRAMVWRELRSLHWLWVSSLPMILSATLLYAVTADDWLPAPYRPWVVLFGVVASANLMATTRWGQRNDLGDAEFLAGLPVEHAQLARVQVFASAAVGGTLIVLCLAVLRIDLIHHLLQLLPPGPRSTLLGTESTGALFNLETALLAGPLVVHAYLGGLRHASRHSQLCEEAAEARAGLFGLALPAALLFVARQGGLALGWWGTGLIATLLLAFTWRPTWQAFLTAQRHDGAVSGTRAAKSYGDTIAMFVCMIVVMTLLLFLFRVGDAGRAARIFAASPLEIVQIEDRLTFQPAGRRYECRAFSSDLDRCRERDERRTINRGGRSEEQFDARVDEFRGARKHPRLTQFAEAYAASPHDLDTFLQRAGQALAEPRLEIEERQWFARSEWSLDDYISRRDSIYERVSPMWKNNVFEAPRTRSEGGS